MERCRTEELQNTSAEEAEPSRGTLAPKNRTPTLPGSAQPSLQSHFCAILQQLFFVLLHVVVSDGKIGSCPPLERLMELKC